VPLPRAGAGENLRSLHERAILRVKAMKQGNPLDPRPRSARKLERPARKKSFPISTSPPRGRQGPDWGRPRRCGIRAVGRILCPATSSKAITKCASSGGDFWPRPFGDEFKDDEERWQSPMTLLWARRRNLDPQRHPRLSIWPRHTAGRVWTNCYHLYPAHAAFGGYKQSGDWRETTR